MASISAPNDDRLRLQRAVIALEKMQARLDENEKAKNEPIAIVGLGCRFPGGASSPEAYWQLLREGVDAITEVPPNRWNMDAFYDSDPDAPGRISSRWGGFIEQVDQFDAAFFNCSPREAIQMDPQQRLLLQVAWEALERAGQTPQRLAEGRTGVFIGAMNWTDYAWLQPFESPAVDSYTTTGTANSAIAGRLSYILDLHGPSVVVDTACSSSLVAIHMACQSLHNQECRVALAGGVSLMLSPRTAILISKLHTLSPDGRCKPFSAAADGFVRGEGCGMLVLKRLSDALADGDTILAQIIGSAINHDGRSNGMTAPNGRAQQAVIREALTQAHVSPAEVSYVEAHGTGTVLGDPIEMHALGAALSEGRSPDNPVAVGSVKANIGHLEAAAASAAVIKVVLALQHQAIPPQLNFQERSPHILWDSLPVTIHTSLTPWNATGRRLAGVSSFGLSGTNAHMILEEAPAPAKANGQETAPDGQFYLLPLSARTPEALPALVQSCQPWLSAPELPSLADMAYTAGVRRGHHEYRVALLGSTPAELQDQVAMLLDEPERLAQTDSDHDLSEPRKLVFVFPGQGSQWLGMGRSLLTQSPTFRSAIERCEAAMQPYVDWSLTQLLQDPSESSLWERIDIIQPVLFTLQVSLAQLWRSWGVEPDAVIGHSLGEVAAFHIAGALGLEDAARVICQRSQLLHRISGQGAMALVNLSQTDTQRALQGYETQLSIAVCNSTRSTVISGEPQAVEECLARWSKAGIFCRPIKVDVASHSPQVDALCPDLLATLAPLQPHAGTLPIYSTVTTSIVSGAEADAAYWARNLRQPVQFANTVKLLRERGHTLFVEISPHPLLLSAIAEEFQDQGQFCRTLPSLRRNEDEQRTLLESLAALYSAGYNVDWSKLYPQGRCVQLPTYAWQGERYWLEAGPQAPAPFQKPPAPVSETGSEHPLLGWHLVASQAPGTHYWEQAMLVSTLPALADHRVQGKAIMPATAYIEMGLSAARRIAGSGAYTVSQIKLEQMLPLDENQARRVQVVLSTENERLFSFRVLSCRAEATSDSLESPPWGLHAQGIIQRLDAADAIAQRPPPMELAAVMAQCKSQRSVTEFYQQRQRAGLDYGPSFRGIVALQHSDHTVLAQLRVPPEITSELSRFTLHPALFDAVAQAILAVLPEQSTRTYVPIDIERVYVSEQITTALTPHPSEPLWSYVRLSPMATAEPELLQADVQFTNSLGEVLLEVRNVRLKALGAQTIKSPTPWADWLYAIDWQPLSTPPASKTKPGTWLVLDEHQHDGGTNLSEMLQERGVQCITVTSETDSPQAWPAIFEKISQQQPNAAAPLAGIVCWWHAPLPPTDEAQASAEQVEQNQEALTGQLLELVQALLQVQWRNLPRLWIVTQAAQAVTGHTDPPSLAYASLWGLGRAIAYEQPRLHCTLVDLNSTASGPDLALLAERILANDPEDQLALRNSRWYSARLLHYSPMEPAPLTSEVSLTEIPDQPFCLEISKPGMLDHLRWWSSTRRAPATGEVEIEVEAAGLNFLDTLRALGVYPGQEPGTPLIGGECAGRIVALGDGVTDHTLGERVMAFMPGGAFSRFVTASAAFAFAIPEHIATTEAATLPIVFATVWYALMHVGRLGRGERLLIHTASGGVGLAALQVARLVGAEAWATAGTPEKRAYLRSLGVEHIFDSRSLAFASQIREQTNGEGLDVVLNTLTGEAARQSLGLLKPFGRFLELSKKDIYQSGQLPLSHFRKNLAYMTIDLAAMLPQRPGLAHQVMQEVTERFVQGQLQPLPVQVFPIAEASAAFRTLAQGKHIGKIALSFQQREGLRIVQRPSQTDSADRTGPQIRSAATYLLTGGLGGLGLKLTTWLAEQGARRLILIGRRPPSPEAEAQLAQIRQLGTQIEVVQADIANQKSLTEIFARLQQPEFPLRGIFHLAVQLRDGVLSNLTREHFRQVMQAKVMGAWNLHQLTKDLPLDHFVLFSSAASLIGSPGQGNYSAANAFLDTLAGYRRSRGLPAVSINWGSWGEIGLAVTQENRGGRLAFQGFAAMPPDQAIAAMAYVLKSGRGLTTPHLGIMEFHLRQWRQSITYAARSPLFTELWQGEANQTTGTSSAQASPLRAQLQAASREERSNLLENHLKELTKRVLRTSSARIDKQTPLKALGFDSLMAVELKNLLENSLDLPLSTTLIWQHPTLARLTEYLAQEMEASLTASASDLKDVDATLEEDNVSSLEFSADTPIDLTSTVSLEAELSNLPAEFLVNMEKDYDA